MKIACCGSSGGGKTTLANLLANHLELTEAITYSRPTAAARAMGYQRANEVPPAEMWRFQWLALFEQLVAERMGSYGGWFVADRSVLDFAAYHLFQRPGAKASDDYVRLAGEHARSTYHLLVVVPPNSHGTEDDGKRHLHGVHEVHAILLDLLARFGLNGRTINLTTDTPDERAREVLVTLRERGLR